MQEKSVLQADPFLQAALHLAADINPPFIPLDKPDKGVDKRHSESDHQLQVSVLPLESLKLSNRSSPKRVTSEVKFLHLNKSKSPSSPTHPRVANAKNIFFRGTRTHFVSEEKARERLEETRMFERERRMNKKEIEKKVQRVVSPHLMREQLQKKFARTEEKRLLAEKKKFKRIKEKPNEVEIAIREKIMRKLAQDPKHLLLSGIAEQAEDFVSQIELSEAKGVSLIPQTESEVIIEEQTSEILKE